jgi:hypothetical protein
MSRYDRVIPGRQAIPGSVVSGMRRKSSLLICMYVAVDAQDMGAPTLCVRAVRSVFPEFFVLTTLTSRLSRLNS